MGLPESVKDLPEFAVGRLFAVEVDPQVSSKVGSKVGSRSVPRSVARSTPRSTCNYGRFSIFVVKLIQVVYI